MKFPARHEMVVTALYVEDNEPTRNVLSSLIRAQFPILKLYTAENGQEGLEIAAAAKPDIIITDICMPQMSGLEMARTIKTDNPEVSIIVLSAMDNTKYLLESIDLGVKHYVLKPVEQHDLYLAIEKCIEAIYLRCLVHEQDTHIRKLGKAVERSPSMVMITDVNGLIEYVNPKFCEVTGYTAAEVVGQNPRMFKGGLTAASTYQKLWHTILSGKEWHGLFSNRKKNGELYWEQAAISPIPDEDNRITHFVASKEDITKRIQAEKEIECLTTTLRERAMELEAVNQELEAFSYSVSHDLRAPLTVINGYSQLVKEIAGDKLDEECRQFLAEISERVATMNGMIESLLNFARVNRSEICWDVVDLSQKATEITKNLKMMDKSGRNVECRVTEGIEAFGDHHLLRVVLDNLLGNAWKYSSRQDPAVIEFGVKENTGKPVFYVRDTGAGFDEKLADKLFIPFQRLHSDDQFPGNGIGLATVKRIIQRHRGQIWAESEIGKGATFYFTLNVNEETRYIFT